MKEFTEFDKELARNIYGRYEWIARDAVGDLRLFVSKPSKEPRMWDCQYNDTDMARLPIYNAFESIRWSDDEPTLIRSIYDPQILTNTEREYLKTVLKPFYEKVVYVAKYRVPSASGKDGCSKEYLFIAFYSSGGFAFPDFDPGKMYSGMKLGKKYKLGELGIAYRMEKK